MYNLLDYTPKKVKKEEWDTVKTIKEEHVYEPVYPKEPFKYRKRDESKEVSSTKDEKTEDTTEDTKEE